MKKSSIILLMLFLFASIAPFFWLKFKDSQEKKDGGSFYQTFFSSLGWDDKENIKYIPEKKEQKSEISGNIYYVSPNGKKEAEGLSPENALGTIQDAVDKAQPGDGVMLLEGEYFQDFVSARNGLKEKPITIYGSSKAVIKGSGKNSRIIEINHDYIFLKGFSVDGLSGDASDKKNYRDKLIYVQGKEKNKGVTGLQIKEMTIKNAGGECIRLRYFAQENEISHNVIKNCGVYDFLFDGKGKNGEGIYIGTAPEQLDDNKNPTSDRDKSDNNWIHHNEIDTQGNECVDIKEGSSKNLVEYNKCTGQKDDNSAGFDSRGNGNIFRYNESYGNVGAGIRLGGDEKDDGIDNIVIENKLHDNKGGGIKIEQEPQGVICGNIFSDNKKGNIVGEYAKKVKNATKCN